MPQLICMSEHSDTFPHVRVPLGDAQTRQEPDPTKTRFESEEFTISVSLMICIAGVTFFL